MSRLEPSQRVLEISAGRGQHLRYYAPRHPDLSFTATECDEYGLDHLRRDRPDNVEEPLLLDLLNEDHWTKAAERRPWQLALGTNFLHMVPLFVHSE